MIEVVNVDRPSFKHRAYFLKALVQQHLNDNRQVIGVSTDSVHTEGVDFILLHVLLTAYGSRDSSGSVAEFLQRPTFKKADIKVDVEDERRQINEILADEDEDKSTESDKIMPICLKSCKNCHISEPIQAPINPPNYFRCKSEAGSQ